MLILSFSSSFTVKSSDKKMKNTVFDTDMSKFQSKHKWNKKVRKYPSNHFPQLSSKGNKKKNHPTLTSGL